ncbi:MAG: hypothetical protein GX230_10290, partial [Lentisphaerae bacterium]|nr:hypothetical protein [Lentisphaerota bacterium]
ALLLYPLFRYGITATAADPLRQAANLHVMMMIVAAIPLLPFNKWVTAMLRKSIMPKALLPEPSHLSPDLLIRPERAIYATIHEIRRMAKLCSRNMIINGELMLHNRKEMRRALDANEIVINEIRIAVGDYLEQLTGFTLSDRQTIFVQHLDRCMKDIERIGDYQEAIAKMADLHRKRHTDIPKEFFDIWFDLFCYAQKVLMVLERSLNPDNESFTTMAPRLFEVRDEFSKRSAHARMLFAEAARTRRLSSNTAYYLHRCHADLDRMMGHARSIAVSLEQPEFKVRLSKLEQIEPPINNTNATPSSIKTQEYLDRLYNDNTAD